MSDVKLQFRCPYCSRVMRVAAKFVGQRGKCNACGGRLLLAGKADVTEIQEATPVSSADPLEALPQAALIQLWEALAPEGETCPMRPDLVRRVLRDLTDADGSQPVTDRQRASLERLGLPADRQIVRSGEKATLLIEEAHLQPTYSQHRALQILGVGGAKVAAARTKAHARVLIEQALQLV